VPDTSTAPTATNAETRAAGSKILGFILGGGGAIVDKLFDVANFLTRAAGGYYQASAVNSANVPTAGAINNATGLFVTNNSPLYGLNIGVAGTGGTWVQCQRSDGAATVYPLMLNPLGGNVGIGTTSPATALHVRSSGEIARLETTTARGSGNAFISINDQTGRKGYVGYGGANDRMEIINSLNADLLFATNNAYRWQILAGGDLTPVSDNAFNFGSGSVRPKLLYAVTGTVNTSDEREKTWRSAANVAELNAAKRIAAELGFYQWNDAIAEKGSEGARYHYGVRAQAVWAIMADEGLIHPLANGSAPHSAYAFLCYDEWDAVEPIDAVEEVRDEEGEIIVNAQPAEPGREAGNRFGIRPDQLALFLIAAQEARLSALEAA